MVASAINPCAVALNLRHTSDRGRVRKLLAKCSRIDRVSSAAAGRPAIVNVAVLKSSSRPTLQTVPNLMVASKRDDITTSLDMVTSAVTQIVRSSAKSYRSSVLHSFLSVLGRKQSNEPSRAGARGIVTARHVLRDRDRLAATEQRQTQPDQSYQKPIHHDFRAAIPLLRMVSRKSYCCLGVWRARQDSNPRPLDS